MIKCNVYKAQYQVFAGQCTLYTSIQYTIMSPTRYDNYSVLSLIGLCAEVAIHHMNSTYLSSAAVKSTFSSDQCFLILTILFVHYYPPLPTIHMFSELAPFTYLSHCVKITPPSISCDICTSSSFVAGVCIFQRI